MIPYTIKTFRGGLSDESNKGIAGSFKYGHGLDIHGRDDVLKCNSSFVTLDATYTGLINFFVPASDGSLYAFSSTGSIYAISGNHGDPAINFAYNDENGAIKGAAEFELSDGNRYIYWSTATSLARVLMNGALDVPWAAGAVTQDYKTTLENVTWHTMKTGAGQLNIANGSDLASVDYDGTFVASDLDIIPGNLIKCLEERDDYIILGTTRRDSGEEGYLWGWITTATSWIQKKALANKGVNALITTELMLAQAGTNGYLYYSDFVNLSPVHQVPGGGSVNPGGVDKLDGLALFGFFGGTYPGVWSYGRKRKNYPAVLNYEYRMAKTVAGSSVTEIGAIGVINGDVFTSWKTADGSTLAYGIDSSSSTTLANAVYEGLEFDGAAPQLTKLIDAIALLMSPLPSGCSVSAKFKFDEESNWRYAVLSGESTTFSTTGETMALFNIVKPGRVYEVGVELTSSGSSSPEIRSLVSYLSKESTEYA